MIADNLARLDAINEMIARRNARAEESVRARSAGPSVRDRIIQFFQVTPGWFTSREVDDRLGLQPSEASKRITDLVREGKLQTNEGKYRAIS